MNKIASGLAAAALAGTMMVAAPAPASANPLIGIGITVGVLGFLTHAAMANNDGTGGPPWMQHKTADLVVDVDVAHQDRCSAHYRSYVLDTDMYMGYDGDWHQCML